MNIPQQPINLMSINPLLEELRSTRFTQDAKDLYPRVKELFQPLEDMVEVRFAGQQRPMDFTPFTAGWAWNQYWGATTQAEVDLVVASWVPTLMLVEMIRHE